MTRDNVNVLVWAIEVLVTFVRVTLTMSDWVFGNVWPGWRQDVFYDQVTCVISFVWCI